MTARRAIPEIHRVDPLLRNPHSGQGGGGSELTNGISDDVVYSDSTWCLLLDWQVLNRCILLDL